ncbi:MAG: hypothetical protein HY337_08440 [Gemmatimonadetes bacterium]|nr:hypothetical protein [Gemmatimonadota bacterium]
MKFLCVNCDEQMTFQERREPGDGTFAAAFTCARCGHTIALLANPMESQLVRSLGVEIGGRTLDPEPMALVRENVVGRADAFAAASSTPQSATRNLQSPPTWSPEAIDRLARVPSFVRGMVRKIYADYAAERGIAEITPAVMDQARADLGLEGM